jgi:hypothetical protein
MVWETSLVYRPIKSAKLAQAAVRAPTLHQQNGGLNPAGRLG